MSSKAHLSEPERLELICEAIRYSQLARRMNAPSADARAVREAIFSYWETYGVGKIRGARHRSLAAREGVLARQTKGLVYDHGIPIRMVLDKLLALEAVQPETILPVLCAWVSAAWITKEEDAHLTQLGFRSRVPEGWDGHDVLARYHAAGIEVEPNEVVLARRSGSSRDIGKEQRVQRSMPAASTYELQSCLDHPKTQKSENRVQALCSAIVDALISEGYALRSPAHRDGFSLVHPDRETVRIDPKISVLRVQIRNRDALPLPEVFRHPGKQDRWIVIRPDDTAEALVYLTNLVRSSG